MCRAQASFVIATIIPISTNTTIATCIQIQNGDTRPTAYLDWLAGTCAGLDDQHYRVGMAGCLRTRMNGRPRTMFLSLTFALCGLAFLAPPGDAKRAPSAHSSATPPLGGVNIVGVGPEPLREADLAIARARALHAKVVRTEVPWSALEPGGPSQIEPRALAFADRLVERRSGSPHSGDRVRRQHALLGVLGADGAAEKMRAWAVE